MAPPLKRKPTSLAPSPPSSPLSPIPELNAVSSSAIPLSALPAPSSLNPAGADVQQANQL
ncbi:hypothetical protein D9615_010566 [Tricholomella constricta]|uniref:Uncharacterized protein n=1 Tax=Tricholomella constricta TaxID=117010 RepID=A0A8H5GMI4_9AGAR|nr:hypothetical protein D9615_010566 [Tricholomella constricta]